MNANQISVAGVSEKQLKSILETGHKLCNGVKGNYRDMARQVFAQLFGSKVTDPNKNHVLQALRAARKCELTLDGSIVAKEKLKISTYEAVKAGKIEVEDVEWIPASMTLKVNAVTM